MSDSNIYSKLRKIRRARGLTVNKLAEKMGESHQKVGRVERGKSNLTVDYLLKLSQVLNTSIDAIIQEETHQEESSPQLLNQVIIFVEQYGETLFSQITPENKAELISTLYTEALKVPANQRQPFLNTLLKSLSLIQRQLD